MNRVETLNYLKVALDMETDRFMNKELLDQIKKRIPMLGQAKTFVQPVKPKMQKSEVPFDDGCSIVLSIVLGLPVGLFFTGGIIYDDWWKGLWVVAGIAFLFAIFGLILVIDYFVKTARANKADRIANGQAMQAYKEGLDAYKRKKEDDAKRIQDENRQKEMLQMLSLKITEYLAGLTQRLKQYYDAGVLHPKYQNLISVSSIYEYLETGICDRLTGPGGAYDTFESLNRMDKIITSIDDVKGLLYDINGSLQDVKRNQFVLYQAVQTSGQNVRAFSDDIMKQIATISQQNQQGLAQLKISSYLAAKENAEIKDVQRELKRIRELQMCAAN